MGEAATWGGQQLLHRHMHTSSLPKSIHPRYQESPSLTVSFPLHSRQQKVSTPTSLLHIPKPSVWCSYISCCNSMLREPCKVGSLFPL